MKIVATCSVVAALVTFGYLVAESQMLSYLSSEPEVCINCHTMNTHYSTWQHSSHREEATCVDCHMRGTADDHNFVPVLSDCTGCHTGTSFETLSGSPGANYTAIMTAEGELLDALQAYANATLSAPIAYSPAALATASATRRWACQISSGRLWN